MEEEEEDNQKFPIQANCKKEFKQLAQQKEIAIINKMWSLLRRWELNRAHRESYTGGS